MKNINKTQTDEHLEETMDIVSDVQEVMDDMEGVPTDTKVDTPVGPKNPAEGVEKAYTIKAGTIKVDKEKFEETVDKYRNDIEIYKKSPRYATYYDEKGKRWHVRDKQTDSTRYVYDEEVDK